MQSDTLKIWEISAQHMTRKLVVKHDELKGSGRANHK